MRRERGKCKRRGSHLSIARRECRVASGLTRTNAITNAKKQLIRTRLHLARLGTCARSRYRSSRKSGWCRALGSRVGLRRWAPSRAQHAFYSLRRAKRTRGLRNLSPAIGTSWGKVRKRESAEVRWCSKLWRDTRDRRSLLCVPASIRLPFNGIKAEETVIGPKAGAQVIGNRNRPEACVSSHSSLSDLCRVNVPGC